MKLNKHIDNLAHAPLHPDRAVAYFGRSGSRNWEPALLWLVIAIVALNSIRNGRLPTGQESVTWLGLAGAVVVAGAIAPEAVGLVLLALLIANVLNANAKIIALANSATYNLTHLGQ